MSLAVMTQGNEEKAVSPVAPGAVLCHRLLFHHSGPLPGGRSATECLPWTQWMRANRVDFQCKLPRYGISVDSALSTAYCSSLFYSQQSVSHLVRKIIWVCILPVGPQTPSWGAVSGPQNWAEQTHLILTGRSFGIGCPENPPFIHFFTEERVSEYLLYNGCYTGDTTVSQPQSLPPTQLSTWDH